MVPDWVSFADDCPRLGRNVALACVALDQVSCADVRPRSGPNLALKKASKIVEKAVKIVGKRLKLEENR